MVEEQFQISTRKNVGVKLTFRCNAVFDELSTVVCIFACNDIAGLQYSENMISLSVGNFCRCSFFSFLVGMPGLLFFFSFSLSFFHFDRQCLATIFSQVATNKIRKRQGAYIQRIRYGSGEKGLSTVRLTNRL